MVLGRRITFRQSLDSFEKSFSQAFGLIVLLLCAACSSKSVQPVDVAPSVQAARSSGSGLALTSVGANSRGEFSIDGQSLLFVSKNRDSHKHSQIYELNLSNFREKRLTFQDGDCIEGKYSLDGGRILYNSTTDELKERPKLLFAPHSGALSPTELYLADLTGSKIERLTNEPGYQGEFTWVGANRILYVSQVDQRFEIRTRALGETKSIPWRTDPKLSFRSPTIDSSATRVAWMIQGGEKTMQIGLKIAGKIQSLETPFSQIQSLQWIYNKTQKQFLLMLSAKKSTDAHFKAWLLDPSLKCHSIFFEDAGGDLKDIRSSQDQQKIVVTFEGSGNPQLFLREFPAWPTKCEPLVSMVVDTSAATEAAGGLEPHLRRQSDSAAKAP